MSSLAEFIEQLHGVEEAERIYAAEDIGYLNLPEGVPALLERLNQETSRAVREAIFQALLRIEADAATEGSIGLLGSDDPQIRNQAVEVLRAKGIRSIPFLGNLMRDGDKDQRKLVLDVLSGVSASSVEAIYEAALSDTDPNVVITAVDNLGRARATQFAGQIEKLLLAASHPMLVGACLEALGGMGDEHSVVAIRQRFPELAAMPDFFLVSCLKAIGGLGTAGEFAEVAGLLAVRGPHLGPAILGALIGIHQRYPNAAEEHLQPGLQVLLERMTDKGDPLCRYQAVRALGILVSSDVHPFLVACLSNPERLVRLGAVESLREAGLRGAGQPGWQELLAGCAKTETDEEVLQALHC